MKFLILTMVLTVVQTSLPVPRKTANSSARTSQNVETQSDNNKKNSAPILPLRNTNAPPTADTNGNTQNPEDARQEIRISELPVVSVKDGGWVFNGLLVVVGFFQVWLLYWTGKTISRQADIAQRQETQMILAREQTERIISQTQGTAQRQLRAYLGVSKCGLKLEPANIPEGQVHIKNFGQTPAYKVRQWINIRIAPYPLTFKLEEKPENLQGSLSAMWPGGYNVNIATHKPVVPPHVSPHLGSDQYTVYVYGRVIYEDIFGKEQYTCYQFIYGGPGGTRTKTDSHGWLVGFMKPDSEGNEAT